MIADFLPSSAADLQDSEAIALLHRIQRQVVQVPFLHGATEIETAFVHYPPEHSSSSFAPVLLIHGFDSSLLEFRRLIPHLAKTQEIWAIDLFGSGFTEYRSSLSVNPETIRQHLLAVLTSWISQPVVLVGASLGGAVVIDFALHYPGWVRSLVLVDSVGFSGSFPIGQFLPDPVLELGADWLYLRKHVALVAASAIPMMNPTLVDALRCSLLHQEMPGWKVAISSFTRSGGYADLRDRITHLAHPTLILWGTNDDVLGTADADRFHQTIPGSQRIWIQHAGHAPHIDQPQDVAAHLLSFMRQTEE